MQNPQRDHSSPETSFGTGVSSPRPFLSYSGLLLQEVLLAGAQPNNWEEEEQEVKVGSDVAAW
jgi:hypothetical protein